jgi:hypothetical protein
MPTETPSSPFDLPSPISHVPSFRVIDRRPLPPWTILLAILSAGIIFGLVWFALRHIAAGRLPGTDPDDPNQVDTIVLGDPHSAPVPAHPGEKPSDVHPTILVNLPRFGEQAGLIPSSPAGHLLYDWLAAFNKPDPKALRQSLPTIAPAPAIAAQMRLRRQTGGFFLLSAKEVQPGLLVFRLRQQSPPGTEALGTLLLRSQSNPSAIASFSLRSVPPVVSPAAVPPASADPRQ